MNDHQKFFAIKDDLTAKLAAIIHDELVKMGPKIRELTWFSSTARANRP